MTSKKDTNRRLQRSTRREQQRRPRRSFPPFNVVIGSSYRQTSFFSVRA